MVRRLKGRGSGVPGTSKKVWNPGPTSPAKFVICFGRNPDLVPAILLQLARCQLDCGREERTFGAGSGVTTEAEERAARA